MDWALIISIVVMVGITLAWMYIYKKIKKDRQYRRRKWKKMSKSEQVKHVDNVMDKWFKEEDF